jgi:hypothetical protein
VAGKTIEKENNRPAVNIRLRELDIRNSRLAFNDKASDPPYVLYIADTNLTLTNLGNHAEHGLSHVNLTGKFMGSGATRAYGTFVASGGGPQFTNNIEIVDTDLTGLNPLLRAYGRFDVAQGSCTVYAQVAVKNSRIRGYVKPMFSNVKVYDPQKDKNKGVFQQTKEMVIGAAVHVFKNHSTQKVATQVDLNGDLKSPDVSTWQAFVEVVRNAFVRRSFPDSTARYSPRAHGSGGRKTADGQARDAFRNQPLDHRFLRRSAIACRSGPRGRRHRMGRLLRVGPYPGRMARCGRRIPGLR